MADNHVFVLGSAPSRRLALVGGAAAVVAGRAIAQVAPPPGVKLARAAGEQIGVTLFYDPGYRKLAFPMGDPPMERGVCTDVVIRAYRQAFGIDLQALVHADMVTHFSKYPKIWGLKRPDRNIDHRRVPNLETFFGRQGAHLAGPTKDPTLYAPGDLVTWRLPGNLPHIGVVDEGRKGPNPLIVHNVGMGAKREDVLFSWPIVDHFRWLP